MYCFDKLCFSPDITVMVDWALKINYLSCVLKAGTVMSVLDFYEVIVSFIPRRLKSSYDNNPGRARSDKKL